ncbi:metalloregulator ArsR/SmtB family transcription factor [Halalkalibacterium halodurans]|jgi:DNA-binding transcriptional ArsR family regulator|uniref:ArsR family transcriptional regulator n=1 Tax=Halalkalibacterium halodurans TaxID=86665 RepID=A0A0M0KCR7_ALKHA|nr:metalloregulator ArsR/SmtB family transcription factor [Halalkalibacterium halodurans]MED4173747.1 metalloregulator ArsR/SmtB family transcription factor [Halalkalibacterium halodurans]TPE70023.1 metalloregulator ArsR/SmtB family transcription factor [Halalkalibacterium halodurans]
MQLNRLVHFHKTLGDKTRIRIIALLKGGPLHGQAIAGKLGLTPPTISHHLSKLREIDVVYQRREKNTIYFYLDEKKLERMAGAILMIGGDEMFNFQVDDQEKVRVIKNFTLPDGRVKTLPAQRKKKLIILEYMLRGIEQGRVYSEKEINEHIRQFHEDFATVRREFVMCQFMFRQNGQYELNPKEMWPL